MKILTGLQSHQVLQRDGKAHATDSQPWPVCTLAETATQVFSA